MRWLVVAGRRRGTSPAPSHGRLQPEKGQGNGKKAVPAIGEPTPLCGRNRELCVNRYDWGWNLLALLAFLTQRVSQGFRRRQVHRPGAFIEHDTVLAAGEEPGAFAMTVFSRRGQSRKPLRCESTMGDPPSAPSLESAFFLDCASNALPWPLVSYFGSGRKGKRHGHGHGQAWLLCPTPVHATIAAAIS